MDVFGFREALVAAQQVALQGGVQTRVVSLPALALLKLVCWQDRYYQSPRKDANDLQMIMLHYLDAGNEPRLWGEFVDWTQEDDFEHELVGPRMLGHDLANLLDAPGRAQIANLLMSQVNTVAPCILPNEMNTNDPDRAVAWLQAVLRGLLNTKTPTP